MIEFRWRNGSLQYRERCFEVDASGALCGLTEFGEWKTVPDEGRYSQEAGGETDE